MPDGTARGLTDGLPVTLAEALDCLKLTESIKVTVVGKSKCHLSASVEALEPDHRPSLGDLAQCDVDLSQSEGTLCRSNDVPIWIPGPVPSPIESLSVAVIEEANSHLVGTVAESPKIQELDRGNPIMVSIKYCEGDDGVGLYEGTPVVVPGGHELVGNRVRLGVSEIRDGFIGAGADLLEDLPKAGDVVTLSTEQYESRDGRVWLRDFVPVLLPEGSEWPAGEVRLGVGEIIPAGISVSVDSLPVNDRPDIGDVLNIAPSDVDPGSNKILLDGVPVQLPSYPWRFNGRIQLGVSGIQPNAVRCSVRGLPAIPSVGDRASVVVDGESGDGSGGRIDSVPTFLPRADVPPGSTRDVLVVGSTEKYLVAVEIDPEQYNLGLNSDSIASYYQALLNARTAWQSDDFNQARTHCQTAEHEVSGEGGAAHLLRVEARRQSLLLFGEDIRKGQGSSTASVEVKAAINSFNIPDYPGAEAVKEELKAYRFTLSGIRKDGSVSPGYLHAAIRRLEEAKMMEGNPWREVIPHPIIATLFASIEISDVPAAEKSHQFVTQTPEYWPFLTLSEIA